MNDTRKEILTSGMRRLFLKLAVPGILGTLVLGLYNLVDGIFVGQFIGPEALGGVTLVYSVVLLNQAILTLFGIGAMALLSIAIGKKDNETITRIFSNVTVMVGSCSFILSILIFIFSDQITVFLGGQGDIFIHGRDYLKILSTGFLFSALGPAINMLFRGEGKIKQAMKILAAGVLLNIILDFIFIYYFKMGVKGAALGTVISQILILILNLSFILKGRSIISFNTSKMVIDKNLIIKMMGIGSSSMIVLIMASLQQIFLFKALATYNDQNLLVQLGAIYRVMLFAFIPFAGLGQGLQSVIGINYGSQNHDRVKKAFTIFTAYASIMAGVLWLLFMIFPGTVLSLLISDNEIIKQGIPFFRMMFSAIFLTGIISNSAVFFQAIGKGKKASLIFLSRQVLFFIPCLLILPALIGIPGIWLSMPAAEVLSLIVIAVLLKKEFSQLNSAMIPSY